MSELADDFVKDPAALFNPGQREWRLRVCMQRCQSISSWALGARCCG